MRKTCAVILMFLLFANVQASEMLNWNLKEEITLKNNGDGTGVRITIPISSINLKNTFAFELVSGEFKSISIYAKGYQKENNDEAWAKCFETWELQPAVAEGSMKSLNTWKKDDEWNKYEDFIITLNGDPDKFEKTACELKLTYRKLTHKEKHTASKFGSFFLMALLLGTIWYLFRFSKNKRTSMILDRNVSNSAINSFTVGMGVAVFLTTLIISIFGSFIVGTITNAPSGFNNDLGFFMIGIPIAAAVIALRYINDIRYNRCPKCHKYGDIIDLGTEYVGSDKTVTYQNGSRVGESTTKTYNDYRQCPECQHTWAVRRTSTSSWGRNA